MVTILRSIIKRSFVIEYFLVFIFLGWFGFSVFIELPEYKKVFVGNQEKVVIFAKPGLSFRISFCAASL